MEVKRFIIAKMSARNEKRNWTVSWADESQRRSSWTTNFSFYSPSFRRSFHESRAIVMHGTTEHDLCWNQFHFSVLLNALPWWIVIDDAFSFFSIFQTTIRFCWASSQRRPHRSSATVRSRTSFCQMTESNRAYSWSWIRERRWTHASGFSQRPSLVGSSSGS